MSDWNALTEELDAWSAAGRTASLWWRDDDATEATAELEELLDLARRNDTALALAVIPARFDASLLALLERAPDTLQVLQHGFAHQNHAGGGEKKIELGLHRSKAAVLEELARGWVRIEGAFGPRLQPALVPPWNRIDSALLEGLPALGLAGLSTYGPRRATRPVKGLWQTNTHVDIMRWKEPRGFLGEEPVLGQLREHLRLRRLGDETVDVGEPTGILTHHLAHDGAAWDFLARLIPRLAGHPACRLLTASEAFAFSGSRA